jgi:CDP-paratose 2-epimerase
MAGNFLVTGGAGFIGSNYVDRLLGRGEQVTIYDNLSRVGAGLNIQWLREKHGESSFRLVVGDVRDAALLEASAREADVIVHLASQVAVTTSVAEPREDFEINAKGTFNVLEAARLSGRQPVILYASTNKVYGGMENIELIETATGYRYAHLPMGVPETQPLELHSPYGWSKGSGDQYTAIILGSMDYPLWCCAELHLWAETVGVEDQGWIAWFIIALATEDRSRSTGTENRCAAHSHITDLLDVYDAALEHIDVAAGEVYNIGGGSTNAISIWKISVLYWSVC